MSVCICCDELTPAQFVNSTLDEKLKFIDENKPIVPINENNAFICTCCKENNSTNGPVCVQFINPTLDEKLEFINENLTDT